MDAIVFADRLGEELAPLNNWYCPARLPLLGRPVVQHAVEACQRAGANRVFLVLGPQAAQIQTLLERGHQWSIELHYVYAPPTTGYQTLLARLGTRLSYPCLAVRGDVIFKHWLCVQPEQENFSVPSLACQLLLDAQDDITQLDWAAIQRKRQQHQPASLDFYPLDSLKQVFSVLINAVRQQEQAAIASGHPMMKHLHVGVRSHIKPTSLHQGVFFLDDHCWVDAASTLTQTCYIGKRCLIDKGVEIGNSIILDDSLVGRGLCVRNALVCQNWLYRFDLDTHTFIDDAALLSAKETAPSPPWLARLLALLVLLPCLPLIGGWTAWNLVRNGLDAQILQPVGNLTRPDGTRVSLRNLNSPLTWLNRLFLLGYVVLGRIHFTGRSAVHKAKASVWQARFNALPVGWVSFAQLLKSKEWPDELYEWTELEYQKLWQTSKWQSYKHFINTQSTQTKKARLIVRETSDV